MERDTHSSEEVEQLRHELEERRREAADREAAVEALRELVRSLEGENGALESAPRNHAAEIELLKRKLFGTKSERMGTSELQLLLGDLIREPAAPQKTLDEARGAGDASGSSDPKDKAKRPPTGRRDLSASKLPVITIDLTGEGLHRIQTIYRADEELAGLPPSERGELRRTRVAPLIEDFFAWVARARQTEPGRTLATKALGYASNQRAELERVLLDGRLQLVNTRSERALRKIVVGRKTGCSTARRCTLRAPRRSSASLPRVACIASILSTI